MFWSCKKNAPKFWKVKINVKLFFVVFTFCEAIINKLTLKAKGKNFKTFLTKQSWAKSKKVERCRDSKGAIQTYLSYFMRVSILHSFALLCFALQKCICNILFCWTFCLQNVRVAPNTFLHSNTIAAKMHLMRTFCFAKMHFCINKMLQMHLMPKCILAYIFQRKMFSCAKMHFCITFSKGKCSASHLTL